MPENNKESTWERRLNTITSSIAVALLVWGASKLEVQGEKQIEMSGEIKLLTYQVKDLKASFSNVISDRYTAKDAERDRLAMQKEIGLLCRKG